MADIQQLEKALRNADAAGDVEAAQTLAREIQRMQRTAAIEAAPEPTSFDKLPWYLKAAKAADDTARNFANTVSFGLADRIAAATSDRTLAEERALSDEARQRAGTAAIGTDLLALSLPSKAASTLIGKALPSLEGSATLPTLAREGLSGTAIGAGMAAGNGDDPLHGAVSGAVGGVAGGAIAKTIGALVNKTGLAPGILSDIRTPRKSLDDVLAEKDRAYEAVDRAGIRYAADDVRGMAKKMKGDLAAEGIDKELHPRATRRMNRLGRKANSRVKKPTSLSEIDTQRQLIGRDVRGPGGEDQMGATMRDNLDRFINQTKPLNANTSDAQRLIGNARELNRRSQVYRDVNKAVEKSKNAATDAGGIAPFRSLLNKGTKGMSPNEADALQRVVRGEGWEQALANKVVDTTNKVGSFGSGAAAGGIAFGGAGGALAGGLAALTIPPLAKKGARAYFNQNLEELLDLLGGGKVSEALLRDYLNSTGGGVGGGILTQREQRRRRRNQ